MNDVRPLGVFDSGVGGLTVLAALRRQLPGESILYLGDTARLPYGSKSAATVSRYTRRNVAHLASHGVKGVLVACNTASALGLEGLERNASLPVWGVVEAGARAAAAAARSRIGILGTAATIASRAYERWLERLRPEIELHPRACPLLVPLVEEGWLEDPITEAVLHRYIDPLLEKGVDTLLLGCTHYPLLVPLLARLTGPRTTLIDSCESVARAVAEDLERLGLLAAGSGAGSLRIQLTDTAPGFVELANRILGSTLPPIERVDLEPLGGGA